MNCGQQLPEGAKFCSGCGTVIGEVKVETAQRKTVYDGELHKCPNCGELINAFVTICPTCDYQLRGVKASSVVKEFADKLEKIEANREIKKTGFFKGNINELTKTDEQKINLIRSFTIPNTKEDIYEFLILASSNINLQRYDAFASITESEKAVSDAWQAKFEQAYRKAKISFHGTFEFKEIENLYLSKISDQRRAKASGTFKTVISIVGPLLLILLIGGTIFFVDNIKIKTENERLDKIVNEVYSYIEQEQFVLARSTVSTLVFSGSTTQAGDQAAIKWDITRQQLLDIIDQAEYGTDYVSGPREVRLGVSHDDLKNEDYSEVKAQLENRGFTNIKTEAVENLLTGWWTSEGSVDKVSVGGDLVFAEDSIYSSDVEIIIYYHAKQ